MLRIGKLTDYAIDILALLASPHSELRVRGASAVLLQRRSGVPLPTVRKLCKTLTRGGVLVAARGKTGGYRLAQDPRQISVAQIVELVEGPLALTACIAQPGSCQIEEVCGTRTNWMRVNQHIFSSLERVTIADMISSGKSGPLQPVRARRSQRSTKNVTGKNVTGLVNV